MANPPRSALSIFALPRCRGSYSERRLGWFNAASSLILLTAGVILSHAQTLKTLVNFDGANGFYPELMSLVQGTDGNFYGTTSLGGTNNLGTVFKLTPDGDLTTLHNFEGEDGASPWAGLALARDGNFYGTTTYGGKGGGTIFKITAMGALTTLYRFCSQSICTDGVNPASLLVQAPNGDFYGTTSDYSANNRGSIFKITTTGKFTTLYRFCSQPRCTDGQFPMGGLILAANGDFYGTTGSRGAKGHGTVFRITPDGNLKTIHNFDGINGSEPYSALVQADNGALYGTTLTGGTASAGTIFKITPAGRFTMLYSFCGPACSDGFFPYAGLIQAADGNFYGTTYGSEYSGCGTAFKMSRNGKLMTLHTFYYPEGCHPVGALLQAANGVFYGATPFGGAYDKGAIFMLSIGSGPPIDTQNNSVSADRQIQDDEVALSAIEGANRFGLSHQARERKR